MPVNPPVSPPPSDWVTTFFSTKLPDNLDTFAAVEGSVMLAAVVLVVAWNRLARRP